MYCGLKIRFDARKTTGGPAATASGAPLSRSGEPDEQRRRGESRRPLDRRADAERKSAPAPAPAESEQEPEHEQRRRNEVELELPVERVEGPDRECRREPGAVPR